MNLKGTAVGRLTMLLISGSLKWRSDKYAFITVAQALQGSEERGYQKKELAKAKALRYEQSWYIQGKERIQYVWSSKKKWQSCTSQTDKQSPNHIEPNRQ